MSEVIVNASPLIFLGNAGRLELLRPLGQKVLVPLAVHREVTTSLHSDRAATAVLDATWLVPIAVDTIPQAVAAWDLGPGESEVIALGLRHPNARLIVDDLAGRRCATALGLQVTGTLGVVIAAYRRGEIEDPSAVLAELRDAGMWLSDGVIAGALRLAGWTSPTAASLVGSPSVSGSRQASDEAE